MRSFSGVSGGALQECNEFVYGETCLPDQRTQRSLGESAVVGNHEPPMGRIAVAEHDVASALAVLFIAEAFEDSKGLATRYAGQLAQTATSTSSSLMGGGIGSPRSFRLSRYTAIAS